MSETPEKKFEDEYFTDHLVVRHPNGQSEKFPVPENEEKILRIGRELDNDIVLVDPRASRYHAEIRRTATGVEIKDLKSANGTILGTTRLEPEMWERVIPGQILQLAETRVTLEQAASAQSTVAMAPAPRPAPVASPPPPPVAERPKSSWVPWAIGLAAVLLLLLLAGLFFIYGFGGPGQEVAEQPPSTAEGAADSPVPTADNSLALQTPEGAPTQTPTPSGPQLAIPEVEIVSSEVRPILLGALPSPDQALLLVKVRVQNVGNAPFQISTDDFSLLTRDGEELAEAGGTTSEEGLKRLGAIDRFNNLNLTPGGSVPESLIFELEAKAYELDLIFEAEEVDPVVLGLGQVDAGRELAAILGTPVAEDTPTAVAAVAAAAEGEEGEGEAEAEEEAATATPTLEPTPTATRPPAIPAPQVVPKSALVGTIAYPVFNGTDYDLYFGQADGSGTKFFRAGASQPAFSPDGSRIAFHSWKGDSRGLVTMDISGANGYLIANFLEDQLPTWTADGEEIIFLTRRTGGRQSQLMRADSATELPDATIVGEGEYPSIGASGQIVFKGWGNTAYGLRIASPTLDGVQTITNVDEDTAPALSPDGQKIAFMSRREGNWEIYVINIDGSGLQRLTDDPADDGLPTWSPDGNALAFVSNRGGPWAVWAMTPDGSGQRQLFTMEGSPDGVVGTDTFASRGWAEERLSWTR